MAKELGPTFGDEIIAAGLSGAPFSWGNTDDSILGRENLTDEQNTVLNSVIDAHDPTKETSPPDAKTALYDHENRIRALEGQPPLTLSEYLTKSQS